LTSRHHSLQNRFNRLLNNATDLSDDIVLHRVGLLRTGMNPV